MSTRYTHPVFAHVCAQEGVGASRFVRDFSYQGTDDPTAWLSMAAALDFRAALPGGEVALLSHLAAVATAGGALLARMWRTETLLPPRRTPLRGAMVNVRLPTANGTAALAVGDALLEHYGTWVPCFPGTGFGLADTYWCRVSTYVYNDLDDFRMLGAAVAQILGLRA